MEDFKKLDELCKPDVRNTYWVKVNEVTGEQESMTLEDVYSSAAQLNLTEKVPDKIKSQFNVAKNLYVYSWFSYPFHQISEMKIYSTVENALECRLDRVGKKDGLKKLLKKAINKKLINDSGFRFADTEDSNCIECCLMLKDTMPSLRNDLSHGGNTLHHYSMTTLLICCDLINQLF